MTDELNLLNAKETAAILKISTKTFKRWRAKGKGPVGGVPDKSTLWMRKDITAWWEDSVPKENQTPNPALR